MIENPGGRHGDEPSPEDRLAGRDTWTPPAPEPEVPVKIHLTDAAPGVPVACIKGLRATLGYLARSREPTASVTIAEAETYWQRWLDGERPLYLGTAEGEVRARAAATAGVMASGESLILAIGLTDEEEARLAKDHKDQQAAQDAPEAPSEPRSDPRSLSPAPPGWEPTFTACKLALALLAQNEGVPAQAYAWASIMAKSDPEGEWNDVKYVLLSAFPSP